MSNPWEHIQNKIEDLRLTIDPQAKWVKELREVVHSEALRLSVEIPYAQRYDKARLEGECKAYQRVWQMLGGDLPEEKKEDSAQ